VVQRSVPIPGEILKTTVIFGLTFNELLVLAAMPLVLVLPSAAFDFIPLWVSLVTVAVGTVGVLIVVAKTPEGQSPVGWFPAYIDRRISPDKYTMKPKDQTKHGAPEVKYVNVVHTAPLVKAEHDLPESEFDVEEFKASIEYADKIDNTPVSTAVDENSSDTLDPSVDEKEQSSEGLLGKVT